MGARRGAKDLLSAALRKRGYEIVPSARLYDWQKQDPPKAAYAVTSMLPDGASDYLREDNPRLVELEGRYAAFDERVTSPLTWRDGHVGAAELLHFRGDNAYVWQLRGKNLNVMSYALAAYYVESIDELDLLDGQLEDTYFGNFVFEVGGRTVSRDLLDSIAEIYFLERHLGLSARTGITVLDVGAGYGRLAHRFCSAFPAHHYLCTDAVPVSTFISEYYLDFRGLKGRASVVPLDEVRQHLASTRIDLAVNIHSFSECRIPAVEWWLALLAEHHVGHLMVVPNPMDHRGERMLTDDGRDFGAVIERYGYRLVTKEPKYVDPVVQEFGLSPTCHYLFELA